jgi:hypothetical protein
MRSVVNVDILNVLFTVDCATIAVKLQWWHSKLTLHARNIPSAVCVAPRDDEHVMLETCIGLDS